MGIIWGERLKLQITELHLGFCKFELHFDTLLLTVSVQFRSFTQLCATLCDPMAGSTPGFPAHHQLPERTQTHVHQVMMASNHLILCRPLLLLPSIFPSI